jgi:non-specific serine/threonine protein kinase
LPGHLPALIGRGDCVAELRHRVLETSLLTLTGTGGCGKTRLALQVGLELVEAFFGGVWLVDLAPVSDASLVVQTVATVLGVQDRAHEPIADTLLAILEHKQILLVLDNCEHQIDTVANLAQRLLRACSGVRLLATSREPLGIQGEITWRVPSLALPNRLESPDLEQVAASPAVQLFIARTQAVDRQFDLTRENARAVAEVCARVDGLPLAIELAAATLRVLGVEELRNRLDDRFALLPSADRTAPDRHRTLQATLDWSHHLLTPAEQVVFRRLAVFAGGCNLEAAESACSGEPIVRGFVLQALTGLVDKSLVVKMEVGGTARYGQLETVRQYARHKLCDAGEEASVQCHHAEWCMALLSRAAPHFQSAEEKHWLTRLEAERNNLRAALAWCATEGNASSELGLGMLDMLGYVWWNQQQQTEGRGWIERILRLDRGPARIACARVLNWGAEFATQQGDLQRSNKLAEEGLQVCREIGYAAGEGVALTRLGTNADTSRLHDHGLTLLEEGLRICLHSGDERSIYYARHKLAEAYRLDGNLDSATRLIEDNLELATRREDRWGIAQAICQLGVVASAREDFGRAAGLLEQSLSLWRASGAVRGPHGALLQLGRVALAQGQPERARKLIGESLRMCRDAWHTRQMALCLHALASVAAVTGEPTRAATLFGAAAALAERVAMPLPVGPGSGYARCRAAAHDQIGAAAFDRAWATGSALPIDQALSEAEELVAGRVCADDRNLMRAPESAGPVSKPANSKKLGRLTTRQTEVLRLVAEGKTDRQIARELVLSEKTVGRHLEDLFARLNVSSRAAASVVAVRNGLA